VRCPSFGGFPWRFDFCRTDPFCHNANAYNGGSPAWTGEHCRGEPGQKHRDRSSGAPGGDQLLEILDGEGGESIEKATIGTDFQAPSGANQSSGIRKFCQERPTHATFSRCASSRMSNIETAGISRTKMRNKNAKKPSGAMTNAKSQMVK